MAGPRADATRNREQLLAVATRLFGSSDSEPSLRAIAQEAGVGIATLYRHFPTRETLVDAVYQDQVTRLTNGARELLAAEPPVVALRRWMDLFGTWVATKNGMVGALHSMIDAGAIEHGRTRTELLTAIDALLAEGRAAAELRDDVSAEDVAAALIGIFTVARPPAQAEMAARLLDVVLDGLRTRPDTVAPDA